MGSRGVLRGPKGVEGGLGGPSKNGSHIYLKISICPALEIDRNCFTNPFKTPHTNKKAKAVNKSTQQKVVQIKHRRMNNSNKGAAKDMAVVRGEEKMTEERKKLEEAGVRGNPELKVNHKKPAELSPKKKDQEEARGKIEGDEEDPDAKKGEEVYDAAIEIAHDDMVKKEETGDPIKKDSSTVKLTEDAEELRKEESSDQATEGDGVSIKRIEGLMRAPNKKLDQDKIKSMEEEEGKVFLTKSADKGEPSGNMSDVEVSEGKRQVSAERPLNLWWSLKRLRMRSPRLRTRTLPRRSLSAKVRRRRRRWWTQAKRRSAVDLSVLSLWVAG